MTLFQENQEAMDEFKGKMMLSDLHIEKTTLGAVCRMDWEGQEWHVRDHCNSLGEKGW